jgi:hypothetical protein
LALLEAEQLASPRAERQPPPERSPEEVGHRRRAGSHGVGGDVAAQLGLFPNPQSALLTRLAALEPDAMTPLQALTMLAALVEEAKRSS